MSARMSSRVTAESRARAARTMLPRFTEEQGSSANSPEALFIRSPARGEGPTLLSQHFFQGVRVPGRDSLGCDNKKHLLKYSQHFCRLRACHHSTEGVVQEGGRVWKSHFDPSFKLRRCFGVPESSGGANTSGTAVTCRTAVYGYSTHDSTFVKWKLCFQAEGSRTPCKQREKCHSSWGCKQLGARTWPAVLQSAGRARLCFLTRSSIS